MIQIENGKDRVTVTFGAFKNIFEKLGWHEVVFDETQSKDIPLNKMSIEQLKAKAIADGFSKENVKDMKKEELRTLFED